MGEYLILNPIAVTLTLLAVLLIAFFFSIRELYHEEVEKWYCKEGSYYDIELKMNYLGYASLTSLRFTDSYFDKDFNAGIIKELTEDKFVSRKIRKAVRNGCTMFTFIDDEGKGYTIPEPLIRLVSFSKK